MRVRELLTARYHCIGHGPSPISTIGRSCSPIMWYFQWCRLLYSAPFHARLMYSIGAFYSQSCAPVRLLVAAHRVRHGRHRSSYSSAFYSEVSHTSSYVDNLVSPKKTMQLCMDIYLTSVCPALRITAMVPAWVALAHSVVRLRQYDTTLSIRALRTKATMLSSLLSTAHF